MKRYIALKRAALFEDGWTYGDWRQYVAWKDKDTAACVRMSRLPFILGLVGTCLVLVVTMAVMSVAPVWSLIAWPRTLVMLFVGFAFIGVGLLFSVTKWRLVVVVGEVRKQADGSFHRVLRSDRT